MGAASLPAATFFLTSIVYLLLLDIGLIFGELAVISASMAAIIAFTQTGEK